MKHARFLLYIFLLSHVTFYPSPTVLRFFTCFILDYVDLSPFTDFVEYCISSHYTDFVEYFISSHSIVHYVDRIQSWYKCSYRWRWFQQDDQIDICWEGRKKSDSFHKESADRYSGISDMKDMRKKEEIIQQCVSDRSHVMLPDMFNFIAYQKLIQEQMMHEHKTHDMIF